MPPYLNLTTMTQNQINKSADMLLIQFSMAMLELQSIDESINQTTNHNRLRNLRASRRKKKNNINKIVELIQFYYSAQSPPPASFKRPRNNNNNQPKPPKAPCGARTRTSLFQ